MADRKSMLKPPPSRPDLDALLSKAKTEGVSDEQLQEQRASFVFGNAPEGSGITKESAMRAARTIKISVAA